MPVEDERVTPVYLISLLGSVSHYERSYHGYSAGRGFDPTGGAPGGGMVQELCSKKEKALANNYTESRKLIVQRSCGWKLEVVDSDKSFTIDLNEWT
ncbi:hypothetical protein F511_23266 [Dorcoceras hygrometricum]|uniref:Uncharacterized protein n=1 Tax=Dorcoceras hygrometricum TaxID=472368 RepID=A0A2Z7CKZ4_9LAMI|nr:hypothetical protein F511_23266 [Dorcoceras hygrometricum]